MAKQRFRDIKQGKVTQSIESQKIEKASSASIRNRLKSFITDSFMLVMPLMYIIFYLVFENREDFARHMVTGWIYILIPLVIIQIIFLIKSGQTPGMRAYNLLLVANKSKERVSWGTVVYRQIFTIVSLLTFGWILIFLRKDHRSLHELISGTTLIEINAPNSHNK